MKKATALLILSLIVLLPLLIASIATAEAASYATPLPGEVEQVTAPDDLAEPSTPTTFGEPLDWKYLGTIAGAAALAMLIVQYTKAPLDYIWKIPTKLFVCVVCLAIMLVATAITEGLAADNALLVVVNALLAAITAYGGYEVTYKHIEAKKNASNTL